MSLGGGYEGGLPGQARQQQGRQSWGGRHQLPSRGPIIAAIFLELGATRRREITTIMELMLPKRKWATERGARGNDDGGGSRVRMASLGLRLTTSTCCFLLRAGGRYENPWARRGSAKGQLILKGLFAVFVWTKKQTKIFLYFCPSFKKPSKMVEINNKNAKKLIGCYLS